MEQTWRVYAPEGRDTSYDTKMSLRNLANFGSRVGRGEIFVKTVLRNDYGDDAYSMLVHNENVIVIAREEGQRKQEGRIFDSVDSGIFFNVSDENARDAESKLVRAFSLI